MRDGFERFLKTPTLSNMEVIKRELRILANNELYYDQTENKLGQRVLTKEGKKLQKDMKSLSRHIGSIVREAAKEAGPEAEAQPAGPEVEAQQAGTQGKVKKVVKRKMAILYKGFKAIAEKITGKAKAREMVARLQLTTPIPKAAPRKQSSGQAKGTAIGSF